MRTSNEKNLQADYFIESQDEEQGIDFAEFFKYLWAQKWTIVAIMAVTFIIVSIYASTLIPIYRTSALLKVDQKSQSAIGIEAVSSMFGQNSPSSAEVILIKSHRVLAAAIDEINLGYTVTPRYLQYIGASMAHRYKGNALADPLFGLDEYAWGGEILGLDRFDISGALENISTNWKLVAGENQKYSLLSDDGDLVLSGKVGESVSANYKDSAFDIFVSQLDARPGVWFTIERPSSIESTESLQSKLKARAEGGSGFHETGIIRVSMDGPDPQKIADIVNAVAHAYVHKNIEDQSKEAQQVLDFVEGQLPALKENLDKAQRSLQEYRQEIETVDLVFETQATLTQLKELEKESADLEAKRDDLKRRFTESHPEVTVITRQMERIQEKRKEIEQQLHALPEREWEFIQKTRDVELATQLYVVLLNKAQELKIARAGMVGNVRIIDLAAMRPLPVKPNRLRIHILGIILGLFLGVAWVNIRRLMHNKLVDPVKIERETGFHVYANIPHSSNELEIYSRMVGGEKKGNGEAKLLACENDTDLAIEALRSFRTSMRFAMKTADNNVIIISGPSPEIGKSFFASNYAAVAAKEGQRVLLIDADMRKGHLHHYMGKAIKPGLSELIANDVTLEEAVHEVVDNLYFISSGERPPNPAELLSSDGFQMQFNQLQKLYDLVIFDTPPILAVTDASVIAQYGGQLFLLLRYGKHHMSEVQAAISLFEKNGVNPTGLVFNDVDISGHGYGYSYNYEYK